MKVQFFSVALISMMGLFSQTEAVRIHATELPEDDVYAQIDIGSDESHCAMANAIKSLLEQTSTLQDALKNKMACPDKSKKQSLLDTGFGLNLCNLNINADLFDVKEEPKPCCP